MRKYILKKGVPEITIMDGELKGHTYKHGVFYKSIPSQHKSSFIRKSVGVKRPFGKEKLPEKQKNKEVV